MLAAFTNNKSFPKLLGMLLIVISLFAMAPLYAAEPPPDSQPAATQPTQSSPSVVQGIPTAADMIENIAKQIPNVQSLVIAIAYVMGMVFIIMGIIRLKHAGEMRTMMSHEHSMKAPLIYIFVGAALIYFPSSLQVGLSTFWTNPNPFDYPVGKDQWTQFVHTCLLIIQLFGIIAFIRGLVMLAQLGGHGGGHQGGLGKSLTHIIGGIFCINISQFVEVVMVTLGIQSPFN